MGWRSRFFRSIRRAVPTGEIRNEVGCLGGRAVFAGPHHRRDRRSLDPLDPSGVLSAHATVRGISNSARDYAPSARRTAQEAGPAGRPASHSVPGIAKRHEYILTQKGLDLYPIMMALVHWGDTHMVDERGRPLLHEHRNCGKTVDPVMVCSECGEPLLAKQVHTHPGPGARQASAKLPP